MKKFMLLVVLVLFLIPVSAEETFNQTFLFSAGGTVMGGQAGSSLSYANAQYTDHSVERIVINFDNVKIVKSMKFISNIERVTAAGTLQITAVDRLIRMTPMTATINGVYYGDGTIGWVKDSGTTQATFYYYIIFDNVNASYANSLTGLYTVSLSYDTAVYSDYSFVYVSGSGNPIYRNTPTYTEIHVKTGGYRGSSFGTAQTEYSVSDEVTLAFNNTTATYGMINVSKRGVNYEVTIYNETGYNYVNQTSIIDVVDELVLKATGIIVKIKHVLLGESVTRTMWSTTAPEQGTDTTAIISLSTTTLITSDLLNYTVLWQQYDITDIFVVYINNIEKNLKRSIAASSTTQLKNGSFQLSDIYSGTNYLTIHSLKRNQTIATSQNFSVYEGSILTDSIFTDKTLYNFGGLVTIYGNASALSRVIITPYDGQQILHSYPVTGAYSIQTIVSTGRYFALLQRQPSYCPNLDGCWSTIVAVPFEVGSSGTLYISWQDPEGDNNKFTTIGTLINARYSNVTSNDTVEIIYPQGTFLSWNVSQYRGSRGFYIPDTDSSIGIWTAKITNGSNASDYITDTISVGKRGRYSQDPTGTGLYAELDIASTTCINTETTMSWNTNISSYFITVTTASKRVMEDNYSVPLGEKTLVFNRPDTYYIRLIDSSSGITWAEKTIIVSECLELVPDEEIPDIGVFIVDDIVGSSWFWAALIIFILGVAAASVAGTPGFIGGIGIGIMLTSLGGLIPRWILFIFTVLLILMLSFSIGNKMGGGGGE